MVVETLHGCTCKTDWKDLRGKKHKGCVYGREGDTLCPIVDSKKDLSPTCDIMTRNIKWCPVNERNCGSQDHRGKNISNWDFCDWSSIQATAQIYQMKLKDPIYYIIGLVVYLFLFGLVLPLIFWKMGWYTLIEVWIPNLDLLATAFSFRYGMFGTRIFSFIYMKTPMSSLQWWSKLIINYIALLGVTFVVARRTYKTHSILHGWSVAFIMLLFTYLVPNTAISDLMEYIHAKLKQYYNIISPPLDTDISIVFGLGTSYFIYSCGTISNLRSY